MESPKLLSIHLAATRLGVSDATLRSYADKGLVSVVRLPSGHRRFRVDDIERLRQSMGMDRPVEAVREAVRLREEDAEALVRWLGETELLVKQQFETHVATLLATCDQPVTEDISAAISAWLEDIERVRQVILTHVEKVDPGGSESPLSRRHR
ncbi:MAG: MerR family transcriptional regulator [Chloroflexia bacterium]|nr:MerR family transcriptional regulator [Chloroflexia bacterium]